MELMELKVKNKVTFIPMIKVLNNVKNIHQSKMTKRRLTSVRIFLKSGNFISSQIYVLVIFFVRTCFLGVFGQMLYLKLFAY